MSVVSARVIQRPRKPHRCVGHNCGAVLHGEHILAFCRDRLEGIEPQSVRLCFACARRWGADKLLPLTVKPRAQRTPGADRTLPQRFADAVRQVRLWQDGMDDPEICETLGLSSEDVHEDLRLFGVDGDTLLAMAGNMAHATAWPRCYRNYYVANAGDSDEASWSRLVELGFAARGAPREWIPGVVFAVTDLGLKALEELGDVQP